MEQNLDNIKGKTLTILLVLILVGVLFLTAGYYLGKKQGWEKGYQSGYTEGQEVERATCNLEAKDSVANPMDNLPDTNPFEESLNPFN